MKPIKDYLPKCPGKGCMTPIDRLVAEKARYPELWGAALMACQKTQAKILTDLWAEDFPPDEDVEHAWTAIADVGLFPNCLDRTSKHARDLFRAAYQGVLTMKAL